MNNPSAFPSNAPGGPQGMSLRDYFAAKALDAYISRGYVGDSNEIAKYSYRLANSMLAARDSVEIPV